MSIYEVGTYMGLGGLTTMAALATETAFAKCLYQREDYGKCLIYRWIHGDISEPVAIMTAMVLGGTSSLAYGIQHIRQKSATAKSKGIAYIAFGIVTLFGVNRHLDFAAQHCPDSSTLYACYYDLVQSILFGVFISVGTKYTLENYKKKKVKALISGLASSWLFFTLANHGANFPTKV